MPKRRKTIKELGTGTDTSQQRIDLSSIDTTRDGGITSLRTREFRGDIAPHGVDLFATLSCRDAFMKKLPEPKVPEFASGAETIDGVTLAEPSLSVKGDHLMTLQLIDAGLRKPYERMLRLRKELSESIRDVGKHVLANFKLAIDVKTADGSYICRKAPGALTAAEKYALGMLYMRNISTPRSTEDEDEEGSGGEEGPSEGEEESDEEEEWEGSDEESSEEDSEDSDEADSDEEYSDEADSEDSSGEE